VVSLSSIFCNQPLLTPNYEF
ncbi:hypothetical protein, partial [Sicyoidochytrium minutum DNA virus]